MNELHIGYLERGEKVYAARVDSVSSGPGDGRIEMEVFIYTQRIDHIRFFWNAGSDSVDFNIGNIAGAFKCMIDGLSEKEYLFEIVSFDKFGNRSLPVEVSSRAYGENYKTYLLNRGIASMKKLDGKIHIQWSAPPEGALYTTVYYKTKANTGATMEAPTDESETVIDDYLSMSAFSYSTSYKPAQNSPDMFESEKSTGVFNMVEYRSFDRNGWTIAGISSEAGGLEADKIIDYDHGSFWHPWYGGTNPPPHWILIDMQTSKNIARIITTQRGGYPDVKTIQYFVSNEPVTFVNPNNAAGLTKITEGVFEQQEVLTLDVTSPVPGRYLLMYLPDEYGSSRGIHEIDVYEIID
jgi:hypothetical protein